MVRSLQSLVMSVAAVAAGVAAAGCGRLAFEPRDATPGDGKPHDAPLDSVRAFGCADATREGFFDEMRFPTIAACAATWFGVANMRAPRSATPCGNDLGPCVAPVDACSPGWHVCMDTGDPADLASRIDGGECATLGGSGRFVAAAGHCAGCASPCVSESDCIYAGSYACPNTFEYCSEPVCCGTTCDVFNGICHAGVFPPASTSLGELYEPCGALPGTGQTGILCCRD